MTRNDRAALKLAMEHAGKDDPARAAQLRSKLKDESWTAVAQFASSATMSSRLLNKNGPVPTSARAWSATPTSQTQPRYR